MGVRSIMRVLIRDVFRAPACHPRSPLQLIIRRIGRMGIAVGSNHRAMGPPARACYGTQCAELSAELQLVGESSCGHSGCEV